MADEPTTSAHPPLIPYIHPDELPAEFSWQARAVLEVMRARTLAFGEAGPRWRITRRHFFVGDACFAQESAEMDVSGWRQHLPSTPRPRSPLLPPGSDIPDDAPVEGQAVRIDRFDTEHIPDATTLADVLEFAATHELARPSSYTDLLQWLLDNDFIMSATDLTMTAAAGDTLDLLRSEKPAGALFAEHQRDEHQLKEIEAGRAPATAILSDERVPGLTAIGQLIDNLSIHDEPATATYAERDERVAVITPWDSSGLPVALNPEYQIPADDPRRAERLDIARQASEQHGHDWQHMTPAEHVRARISILAPDEPRAWVEAHEFDLYARWLVGWVPGMTVVD